MRTKGAKRVFLLALALCFALLVGSYASKSVEHEMALNKKYPRKNTTLTLEILKYGVIKIDGEGKLSGTDMDSLLKESNIRSKRITNIIIGDGITQIGYGVFTNRAHLRTLKLGANVQKVSPGGLKGCKELRFIFIPSGLERVGKGFLYDCNDCRVVTDGSAEEIQELVSSPEEAVIWDHINSYEAMREANRDEEWLPFALKMWWD